MPATYANHRAQLKAILRGWGMPEDNAEITAEVLAWSDLHGVDSHGISMIPGYDESAPQRPRAHGRPAADRLRNACVGGGGRRRRAWSRARAFRHVDSDRQGQDRRHGRRRRARSAHFGAAGFYTLMAAKAGLVGMACTSASGIQVAPTFGKQARLGTDPWSFAAPSADGVPFLLDMATTTVAAGRIRNKANESLPTPDGWVLDREGRPSNDPLVAKEKGGFLTSLGGSPENSSYKGYGLAVMVNILASCLSGATSITDPEHTKKPVGMDIGHFFMAIDPGIFRGAGDFESRRRNVPRRAQGHDAGRSGATGDGGWRSAMETGGNAPARRHSGRSRTDGAGAPDRAGRRGAVAARLSRQSHGAWLAAGQLATKPARPCSGLPAQEIGDQPEAGLLALLRMELRAGDVVPADHRGNRPAVVRLCDDVCPVGWRRDGRNARSRRATRCGPVGNPASNGCSWWTVSVFQPMCGILSAGS